MKISLLTPSLLCITATWLFPITLVGAESVKCPSSKGAEITRGNKKYVLACGQSSDRDAFRQIPGIKSAEECAERCSQNERCVHAEWSSSKQTCSLKSGGSLTAGSEDVYSWILKKTTPSSKEEGFSSDSDEGGFTSDDEGFTADEDGFTPDEGGFTPDDDGFTPDEGGDDGFTPDDESNSGDGFTPDEGGGFTPDPDDGDGFTPDPDDGDGFTPDPDEGDGFTPDPDEGGGFTPDPDEGGGFTPDPDDGDGFTPDPDEGDGFTPDPDDESDSTGGFLPEEPDEPESEVDSCMKSLDSRADILNEARKSLAMCCSDDETAHESLLKDFGAIVNSAFNLLGQYCSKTCDGAAPMCFSLPLNPETPQTVDATTSLTDLPQNVLGESNHVYDFDTWLGPIPEKAGFTLWIYDKHLMPPRSALDSEGVDSHYYLIPAGTKATDLKYRSAEPVMLTYYGVCSEHLPCVTTYRVPWTEKTWDGKQPWVLDVSGFGQDMVLSIADVYTTSEQHAVFIDGKEIGRTHGPLALGDDKFDPAKMPHKSVSKVPNGSVKTVLGQGFWGSFVIPRETKEVEVRVIHPINDVKKTASFRLDQTC